MAQSEGPDKPQSSLHSLRVLVVGLVAVAAVVGIALLILAIGQARSPATATPANALAESQDQCVVCHRTATPGIVEQYSASTMAVAKVGCRDCHEVKADYPEAVEHEGTFVLGSPTPAKCQRCHGPEVAEFYQSRHSLPAYTAVAGSQGLSPTFMAMYQAIPEGGFDPNKAPHPLFVAEGPDVTPFACSNCHSVGQPRADGSVGQCQKCHLRHTFSLEQARKPETCNACHIGPDHPQWEIYQESPHGIAYATSGATWHWQAEAGTLTVNDFPAPTCATCHISGFGANGTTHDVGDRLTWFLFAATSQRRPDWQTNQTHMQTVCRECHNETFIKDFYTAADKSTEAVNAWVKQSDDMMAPLQAKKLLTDKPFDEPIDFTYFELWHNWGRTAKFGTWMQGPDYTQWHGAYEVLSDLAELRQMVDEKLKAAQIGE